MVSLYRWKKKNPLFDQNRVVLNPNKVQTDYEYIIVCKKSSASILKIYDSRIWTMAYGKRRMFRSLTTSTVSERLHPPKMKLQISSVSVNIFLLQNP